MRGGEGDEQAGRTDVLRKTQRLASETREIYLAISRSYGCRCVYEFDIGTRLTDDAALFQSPHVLNTLY